MPTTAARDSRSRRLAARQDLVVRKSRRRCDHGGMWLFDIYYNGLVDGPFFDYDDIDEALASRA